MRPGDIRCWPHRTTPRVTPRGVPGLDADDYAGLVALGRIGGSVRVLGFEPRLPKNPHIGHANETLPGPLPAVGRGGEG